jgi:hypothetical protein
VNAYAWFEFAVIAVLVGWSTWTVFGRMLPAVRSRLLKALGRESPKIAAGCDSGCSSCAGCATVAAAAPKPDEQTVRFDRQSR